MRLLVGALVALVVAFGPAAPAAADTMCADVWVEYSTQPDWYVLGPGNCTPTPFPRVLNPYGGVHNLPTPTWAPNGIGWDIWLIGQ
ncbi:MAG: hypothetical protein QOF60_1938 [Actinomycetota bacterium]|jgi:hypothetical protein|nr:hypothetical protein [Actinomycetota bacterium]